jgi:hypothetical protein
MGWLILIGLVLGAWARALPGSPKEPTPYLLVPVATIGGGLSVPFILGLTGQSVPDWVLLVIAACCGVMAAGAIKLAYGLTT